MIKRNNVMHNILLIVAVVIILLGLIGSYTGNRKDEAFQKFTMDTRSVRDDLIKYAYGTYEEEYNILVEESYNIQRNRDISKISEIKSKYKELLDRVLSLAPGDLGNYYNEVVALDKSILEEAEKNEVNKDIEYIRILIEKKQYRIAYNESVRIKTKINELVEERKKIEEEKRKKQEEELKRLEEEARIQEENNRNNYNNNNLENTSEPEDSQNNIDNSQNQDNNENNIDNSEGETNTNIIPEVENVDETLNETEDNENIVFE